MMCQTRELKNLHKCGLHRKSFVGFSSIPMGSCVLPGKGGFSSFSVYLWVYSDPMGL